MAKRIVGDIILWVLCATLYIFWRLITQKVEIVSYILLFAAMMCVWCLLGLILGKYKRSYKDFWFWQEVLITAFDAALLLTIIWFVLPLLPWSFSWTAVWGIVALVGSIDFLKLLVLHYRKYALNMTIPVMEIEQRKNAQVKREEKKRSEQAIATIHDAVLSLTTEEDYEMLLEKAHLDSNLTKVVADRDRFSFLQIPDYQYNTLVDLTLLNETKGINKRFCIVNQKLPDNGVYVCCYRPQEYVKEKIFSSYPKGINYVVYFLWFIYRRVLPRLLLISRMYYDVNNGRKRVLSKAEVLGRLYYCGFEVDEIVPSGHIEYVFAHHNSQPYEQEQIKVYGPLIKLPRISKNEEIIYVYKFRTMHPYSEYIQKYVFDSRGGMNIADKSDDDWRITRWGKWMRKYWLDELPMLINLFKGDLKLVGIRPLSRTMFDTYPEDLQKKRTRCKPGLIPPFYIDHPQTYDELFASENKYLDAYLEQPFLTDVRYFFMTIYSILFKRMHSA